MVLTVSFVISPVIGLFCHRRQRKASANLTPASRRQDHTTSPSASAPFVSAALASTASRAQRPGRSRYAPHVGREVVAVRFDLGEVRTVLLLLMGLVGPNHVDRVQLIRAIAVA